VFGPVRPTFGHLRRYSMSVLSHKNQAKSPDAYCEALKLFAARATSFSTAQSHDLSWSRGLSSRRCSKPPVQKAAREALTHPGESGPAGPAHGRNRYCRVRSQRSLLTK